jgi:hypothetical protein
LRRRVNGQLQLRYARTGVTSYAGVEFVRRYLHRAGIVAVLRRERGTALPPTDFGVVPMVLLVLTLLLSGGRRLRHLLYLDGDPLVQRLCGLWHLPTPRTVGRWLHGFRARHLARLQRVNALVVARAIRATGARRLTIDVDGSVVSTGLQVAWAKRGFNPHRRKVPSYYPITAYEAQSGHVLRMQNRPGNVYDGKAGVPFLRAVLTQLRATLPGYPVEFRMDGAFFRRDVLALVARAGATYAIKVPFYPWVGLKERVRETRTWTRVTATVSCADHAVAVAQWDQCLRVVVYRTHVQHATTKNFQLDLFDPSDGHYEYSAVVTNKTIAGPVIVGLHVRPRRARESLRRAQERLRLRLRPDDALCGEQRLAAAERPRLQPQRQLPARHDGRPPAGVAETAPIPAVVTRFKRLDRLLAA